MLLLLLFKIKYLTIVNTSPLQNLIRAGNFTTRLKQANVATKGDIVDLVEKTDFDVKLEKLNIELPQTNQNIY